MPRQEIITGTYQPLGSAQRIRKCFDKADQNFVELYNAADRTNTAVTATTDGTGTGLIPATANFVTAASDNANKQIALPAASVGKRLTILVGATGCELISSVATHKVNNVVVGATNEAALTANNTYELQYVAVDTWLLTGLTNLGAVQTAVIPDAR